MARSNIIYPNLRSEMARKGICIQDVAELLEINRSTAGKKLSGKNQINLDEAFKISRTFFPNHDLRELFATDQDQADKAS